LDLTALLCEVPLLKAPEVLKGKFNKEISETFQDLLNHVERG
jgi:hypothetical protein